AALKLTAKDLLKLGLVDEIIPEPDGGAHADPAAAAAALAGAIGRTLDTLGKIPKAELLDARYAKFRAMGVFTEGA
ncbi:MAG: acetyl-CoA carboxylase carboxyl transferase subunit alpha, partial [Candidatus Eisenbacteria bacterium]|nr:acetyl-CoA carboxylase carboxyl transferase subunit alpha [Candidatus Eisenbacteria bacterium]